MRGSLALTCFAAGLLGAGCTTPRPLFDGGGGGALDGGRDGGAIEIDAPSPDLDAPGTDAPGTDAPGTDAPIGGDGGMGTDAPIGIDAGMGTDAPLSAEAVCDATFGGLPGYVLCAATATTCQFYSDLSLPCREACRSELPTSDCSRAEEAESPGSCTPLRSVACGSGAGDLCTCFVR